MRLLTLLLDAFSRSVNRKSSVTCESDLYRSDAVVRSLHGRTGIEEKDRLWTVNHLATSWFFCEHVVLAYICMILIQLVLSVRMLRGGPGLSYLRISARCSQWHIQRAFAMEYKEFSFGSYYPLLVFSLVDPPLAPSFFLSASAWRNKITLRYSTCVGSSVS